jgi:hypothetical protein
MTKAAAQCAARPSRSYFEALEHQAELAVRGDYWETGRIIAQRRRRDVAMNTEVRDVADES